MSDKEWEKERGYMDNITAKSMWWRTPIVNNFLKFLLTALFAFGLFNAVYSSITDSTDLQEHWFNTKNLISGSNIYDDAVYNQIASAAASQYSLKPYDMYPIFPPSCYAILTPFALMNWQAAKISWLVLSLLLTFLLAKELSNMFCSGKHFPLILAALVCSIPWRQHILYGQNAIWSLYFFILSVKLNGQKKTFLSGLALALALFKYSLIGPMCLYFLVYKRVWKNLLIAAGIHGAVLCFFSLYLHQSILYLILTPLKWCGHKSGGGAYDLFGFWSLLNGHPAWIPYIGTLLALAALVFVLSRKNLKDEAGVLTLAAMVSTMLIYHSMNDYVVLVFPVAWLLAQPKWDKGLVLFCVGIFLVGYLRGHYFHFSWQPSHAYVGADATTATPSTLTTGHWTFKTYYAASYSLFWYLSIAILGTRLVRASKGSGR
jgi:Glycosyltransferase family 87